MPPKPSTTTPGYQAGRTNPRRSITITPQAIEAVEGLRQHTGELSMSAILSRAVVEKWAVLRKSITEGKPGKNS